MKTFWQFTENKEDQYWRADRIAARHHLMAAQAGIEPIDLENASLQEILDYLKELGEMPEKLEVSPFNFAAQIKSVARKNFDPSMDLKRIRKGYF
jgi:hypothetical protein